MRLSAVLLLSSCLLAPQAALAQEATVLAKADLDSLRAKMQEWIRARLALKDADEGRREAARKKEDTAREKFLKEWDAKTAKKNAMASVPDLRAVFAGCFEFEKQMGAGDVRPFKPKNFQPYDAVVPKKYKSDVPAPVLVLVRGHDGKSWAAANDWFAATWKAAPEAADYVMVLPALDNSLDLDPVVDPSKPEGEAATGARNQAVLGGVGAAYQTFNLDRDRVFLDCAKGGCAFALRLVSYFPSMFAGVVLRHPTDVGDLRLEGLAGFPVLLLRSDETKEAADKLAEALNKLEPNTATVLDAKGAYPFAESAGDILAWLKGKSRQMMRPHVVVANTHDTFRRAFWVKILRGEFLADVSADNRPLLDVKADRATNTITVTARSVTDFELLLNDVLVDLDKDVTLVVNGQAQKPKRIERFSIKQLVDAVTSSRDYSALFTASLYHEIKAEAAPAKAGGAK